MARRWIYAAMAIPVVVVAAAAAAALSFEPNSQKERIVEAVRRATGRELTLAGPIRLGWSFTPVLEAEDVSFANMAGGTRPAMATAARMEARLRLWPLLSHEVELAQVTLVRPDILIETDAAGRGNWQFDRPSTAAASAPSPETPGVRARAVVDSLRIENGRLTWHDGATGRTIVADVPQATLDGGGGPLRLVAAAELAGTSVTLDAQLGTIAQLSAPGAWPVTVVARLGDAALDLKGTADPTARTLTGRVEASVPDLARLGAVLQAPGWLPLHDIHLAASLPAAGGMPQDVSLQLGAADLGRLMPGASLGKLSLTWPAGQPARLQADGMFAGDPWHVSSGLVPAGAGAALRGLGVSSAVGDLAGDVAVSVSPRPAVRGTLVSTRINLDAIRAAPQPAVATPGPPQPAPVASSRVFSDIPLPWAALRRGDADLQLTIATLHAAGADYRDVTVHVVLQDGVLRVDPASLQAPEGRIVFSASADARQAPPPVAVTVRSAAFAIDPLIQALGLPGGSAGTAELDLVLHAAGATPHALASSLDGHVGIALVDGEVSNAALSAALGDVLRSAGARLDTAGRSPVRCLAVRADAQSGQVTLAALKLDTSRLSLDGGGAVNLADETVALRLRPLLRLGGAGVSAPLRLDGTLRHPAVALDALGSAGRVGVVIGGLAGPADSCTAELTAARDGRAGALPADAPPTKGVKPADLLRGLLR